MRRLATTIAAGSALLAIVGAPGALAAGQQHERFHDVGTEVDPDFCGTGQEIDIAFDVWVNAFQAPNRGFYKETARGKVTFTNPLTGDIVIFRFANTSLDVSVSGDPDGVHVIETAVRGLPELIKTPHGGVLNRDAGYIVVRNTFMATSSSARRSWSTRGRTRTPRAASNCSARSCRRHSGSKTDLQPAPVFPARPVRRGAGVAAPPLPAARHGKDVPPPD